MVSGTLDFSIGFIHYIQDNQKRHSRRERSVLRIKIENQKLNSEESQKFMKSVRDMIAKIKEAFHEQLNNMYQAEIIDTDAELKVFEEMLKSDGFLGVINIKK